MEKPTPNDPTEKTDRETTGYFGAGVDQMLHGGTGPPVERETEQTERELSRIGAMMDGHIVTFTFRDFIVARRDNSESVAVMDVCGGGQLGGYMSLRHASPNDVHAWLELKARRYGA